MAVLGLGTDIVEIARIKALSLRYGGRFAQRLLSTYELSAYQCSDGQQTDQSVRFLAKRFAVKEAAAKALGTGICHGITLSDFEVQHDAQGRPFLVLHRRAAEIAAQQGIQRRWVSIADERCYAVATVLYED